MAGSSSEAEIRLLLVEDMPQVAQYIRNLLDSQSRIKLLDVVTEGRAVLEQVREHQPDVLIVDALLQGKMNGLQVASEIRDAGLDLPIIALTVPQKPVRVGEGMGNTRVMSMPFSGYDFMRLMQYMHAQHRARSAEALSRVYSFFGAKGGVGTTTLAYMQRAKAMSDTLIAIDIPADKVRYLVNRSDSSGGMARDSISQLFGHEPDFEVVSDGVLVLEANNRGQPFTTLGPEAKITRDISRVAREMTRTVGTAGVAAAALPGVGAR